MMKKEKTVAKYTIELQRASSDNTRRKTFFCTLFALFCDCTGRKSKKMHWDIR